MKHLLITTLVVASFSGIAHANSGIYTSLKAGISDTKLKQNEFHGSEPTLTSIYKQDSQSKSIYPNISAAIGFDFSSISNINARAEIEYNYKDSTTFDAASNSGTHTTSAGTYTEDIDEQIFSNKLKSQSLMLNGYYDFKNTSKFTPYVSAGIGVTHIKNEFNVVDYGVGFSDSKNHFTWSAGVGVAYNVTDNVALDLGYKYVDAGKFKFNEVIDTVVDSTPKYKVSSNDYSLGIRYNF